MTTMTATKTTAAAGAGQAPGYAHSERRVFGRLAELGYVPEVVYDIGGSNAGWSTVLEKVWPAARFELFEPLAGRCDAYDRVLERVLRTRPRFRVHPVALGERNGTADFWHQPNAVGSSLLVKDIPAQEKVTVPVRRLDDLVAELSLPDADVIKVDVQGGELKVISGGQKAFSKAKMLHLETWLRRSYGGETPVLPEVILAVRELGFTLVELGDIWRNTDQELMAIDAFFGHRSFIAELEARGLGFPWSPNPA